MVFKSVKLSDVKKKCNDRLQNDRYSVDEKLHFVKRFGTKLYSEESFTLETHLKRLNKKKRYVKLVSLL